MTKEKKIREAYEEISLPFNENIIYDNGWTKIKPGQYSSKYDVVDLLKLTKHVHSIRPKSLSGIENNNGWIRITDVEKVPTENCWIYKEWIGDMFIGYFYNEYGHNVHKDATHYQPIVKPKPPLY